MREHLGGEVHLTAKNAVNFYGRNDDRYRITCRDCGYTDYAKNFKAEIARRPQ